MSLAGRGSVLDAQEAACVCCVVNGGAMKFSAATSCVCMVALTPGVSADMQRASECPGEALGGFCQELLLLG